MKIPSNTFMLVMSLKDFNEVKVDKIFDPHCTSGYVYILRGEETPEIFNERFHSLEKEVDYWKKLAGHRLKGVLYWRHQADKVLMNQGLNDKNTLLERIKKDYNFHGKQINVPFGTRHTQRK